MKNLTDKTDVFTCRARNENTLIVSFNIKILLLSNIEVKPKKLGKNNR